MTTAGSSLVITLTKIESVYGTNTINFIDDRNEPQSFSTLLELIDWLNEEL